MVELNETNLIMQHATPHSLAILDEFGRGTSTHGMTTVPHSSSFPFPLLFLGPSPFPMHLRSNTRWMRIGICGSGLSTWYLPVI